MLNSAANLVPSKRVLTQIRGLITELKPGLVYLFQGEANVLTSAMEELIDRFALRGAVNVVAGGNRVSFDRLPNLLGEQAHNIYEIVDRISVSRTETCYQMFDVLRVMDPSVIPLVITDLLDSFYEEDLEDREVELLLVDCLRRIKDLCQVAPLLVSASGDPVRPKLLHMLETISDLRFYFLPPENPDQGAQLEFPGIA